MATIFTATQQAQVSLTIKDKKGNTARLDGIPQWASSDPNVMSVEPSADGMSAKVVAGQTGTAQISVTGDADLGSGVRAIVGVGDVEVVGGEASVIQLAFGTPSDQAA